uniref:Uncharacterized protein n=1 Tax=Candidatus Kentrum sp. FW TaxID=2126338 RepID=A0A450S2M1_9GAMM|nr:MAG: hypothetical protein BECKFW1821A_GA0114235_101149 [Candidatus Kentron sp. FW]
MEAAPERPWPLVVTCGPPEFKKQLRDDAESSPEIHEWLLAPVDVAEAEKLRDWFRERTGDIPKTGPAFRQARDGSPGDGGLMLSLAGGHPEHLSAGARDHGAGREYRGIWPARGARAWGQRPPSSLRDPLYPG